MFSGQLRVLKSNSLSASAVLISSSACIGPFPMCFLSHVRMSKQRDLDSLWFYLAFAHCHLFQWAFSNTYECPCNVFWTVFDFTSHLFFVNATLLEQRRACFLKPVVYAVFTCASKRSADKGWCIRIHYVDCETCKCPSRLVRRMGIRHITVNVVKASLFGQRHVSFCCSLFVVHLAVVHANRSGQLSTVTSRALTVKANLF